MLPRLEAGRVDEPFDPCNTRRVAYDGEVPALVAYHPVVVNRARPKNHALKEDGRPTAPGVIQPEKHGTHFDAFAYG